MPEQDRDGVVQMRLGLEEVCCDFCRFRHAKEGVAPQKVRIDREFPLGRPDAFADIRVETPGAAPYYLEVKYGYSAGRLAQTLARKYGPGAPAVEPASKVVLVIDDSRFPDWPEQERRLRSLLRPGLALETWGEARLASHLNAQFGLSMTEVTDAALLKVRAAVNEAKCRYAFGRPLDENVLHSSLLWHFGVWRLRQLHQEKGLAPEGILSPGHYPGIVVLLADLCSFSSYVRDTPEPAIVRQSLTAFYSKARYAIINRGGMLYQFVGDEVIAFFGIAERRDDDMERALDCARALMHIGNSVSNDWQRQIDRVQRSGGIRAGITVGDIQIVPLRPYTGTHFGALGDSINLAARLMDGVQPGEVAVSNSFYQKLPRERQAGFAEVDAEVRNMGRIRSWKCRLADGYGTRTAPA